MSPVVDGDAQGAVVHVYISSDVVSMKTLLMITNLWCVGGAGGGACVRACVRASKGGGGGGGGGGAGLAQVGNIRSCVASVDARGCVALGPPRCLV